MKPGLAVHFNVRRLARGLVLAPLCFLLKTALRVVFTGLVFLACTVLVMRWLGHPVPGLSDLGKYFESLEHLSKILS